MSESDSNTFPGRVRYLKDWEDTLTDAELVYIIGRRIRKDHRFGWALGGLINIIEAGWDDGNAAAEHKAALRQIEQAMKEANAS